MRPEVDAAKKEFKEEGHQRVDEHVAQISVGNHLFTPAAAPPPTASRGASQKNTRQRKRPTSLFFFFAVGQREEKRHLFDAWRMRESAERPRQESSANAGLSSRSPEARPYAMTNLFALHLCSAFVLMVCPVSGKHCQVAHLAFLPCRHYYASPLSSFPLPWRLSRRCSAEPSPKAPHHSESCLWAAAAARAEA